jgi:hypothetical protein
MSWICTTIGLPERGTNPPRTNEAATRALVTESARHAP